MQQHPGLSWWSSYRCTMQSNPWLRGHLLMHMHSGLSCYTVFIYKTGWERLTTLSWLICCLPTATHSSILAWEIPWRKEPGRLQTIGSQRVERVRHNWASNIFTFKRQNMWGLSEKEKLQRGTWILGGKKKTNSNDDVLDVFSLFPSSLRVFQWLDMERNHKLQL